MKTIIRYLQTQLSDLYPPREIEALSSLIMEHASGYTPVQQHLHKNEVLPDTIRTQIYQIVSELRKNVPIQYVLGYTYFYDCKIRCTPAALIPRTETEELVHEVLSYVKTKTQLRILDIGTGTGCIPVALAKNAPQHHYTAIDLSPNALQLAQENADTNHVEINFIWADILEFEKYNWTEFDIIVSNPPYIENSQSKKMDAHVTNHEPHLALFVPDADPLLFYRRIGSFGRQYLSAGGRLYFEINEAFGAETRNLLIQQDYENVQLQADINGKDRMLTATK